MFLKVKKILVISRPQGKDDASKRTEQPTVPPKHTVPQVEKTFPTDDCRHIATNSCHSLNEKINPAIYIQYAFEKCAMKTPT